MEVEFQGQDPVEEEVEEEEETVNLEVVLHVREEVVHLKQEVLFQALRL